MKNLKKYKNTQFYILGCKKGCKSRKCLIYTLYCGETGIRTPGASQHNGFQDRRNRPLCHLSKTPLSEVLSVESGAKVRIIFKSANIFPVFSRNNCTFVPMIYPQNFEQKIGFDQIRQLLKDKCLSTLGEERVTDMVFSDRFNEVEERLDQVTEFVRILQ